MSAEIKDNTLPTDGSKDTGTGLCGGNKIGQRYPSDRPSVNHSFSPFSDCNKKTDLQSS